MAACDKCLTGGFDVGQMMADPDPMQWRLLGPCCQEKAPELEYGIIFSSKIGIKAFMRYAGFSVEFNKTTAELNKWATRIQ